MNTHDIFNGLPVNDHILTGGQPTAEQLQAAATEGFQAVINLAGPGASRTLEGEAELVRALGMTYLHIPVDWENPTPGDFAAFERALRFVADAKTLLHCAANYRVTAFYSLYAQKHLGWSAAQAHQFRAQVWDVGEYPVWERFIAQIGATIQQKESNPMDETQSEIPVPAMIETIEVEQPTALEAESTPPDDQTIHDTLALGVSAGNDAHISDSLILGGVVAGHDASLSDGGAFTVVAGADLQLEDGGALVAVVGGDTHVKDGGIGILIGGGDVHLAEGSQVLMTSQQAVIIGLVAGAVLTLLSLILRRK
jgi:protein tyrosine phosphatase (PTP) superfamily phosphohydrolase (DUF442 family)